MKLRTTDEDDEPGLLHFVVLALEGFVERPLRRAIRFKNSQLVDETLAIELAGFSIRRFTLAARLERDVRGMRSRSIRSDQRCR